MTASDLMFKMAELFQSLKCFFGFHDTPDVEYYGVGYTCRNCKKEVVFHCEY